MRCSGPEIPSEGMLIGDFGAGDFSNAMGLRAGDSGIFPVYLAPGFESGTGSESIASLCANISETSCPSTITVGRGKKYHLDKHEQVQFFFRCVGSFGA